MAALAKPETLATDTGGERIDSAEEYVAQVSSKHNDSQVEFYLESEISLVSFTFI